MDGITLLLEAQAAGLSVRVDGDKLIIRGPRSAELIARRLLAYKPAVVAALRGPVCRRHPRAGTRDFPIHGGRSTRRDCAVCERFISFPLWYGNPSRN
jgi:hypothetical protein